MSNEKEDRMHQLIETMKREKEEKEKQEKGSKEKKKRNFVPSPHFRFLAVIMLGLCVYNLFRENFVRAAFEGVLALANWFMVVPEK